MYDITKAERYLALAAGIKTGEKFLYFTDPHYVEGKNPAGRIRPAYEHMIDVMGEYFRAKLNEITAGKPIVKEIRGIGLMVGVELNEPVADDICKALQKKGFFSHNDFKRIAAIQMRQRQQLIHRQQPAA